MTYFKLALVLHAVATLAPVPCTSEKAQKGNEFANPGKIFSEMEAGVAGAGELSIERSLESLRRIVKRVAPEQNGEYQVYQGVSGQPGVDFPALTSIPATSFTCRGMKGGYYADLETNCQVFHICDNGRKISFLCPNGTIFQQSQLICDWWFKVECSKSAEYYESSSEQLAEEERKRAESRRNKQNYERENSRDYVDVQSLDYDGKQNARINPSFDEQSNNRIKANRQFESPSFTENRDPLYSEVKDFQGNSRLESPNYRHSTPHRTTARPSDDYNDSNSNRYTTASPESRNNGKRVQNYQSPPRNSNPREDKVALKRQKFKNVGRVQPNSSSTGNTFNPVSPNTPKYMESTTFRATSPQPPKEAQQVAESAAFVSNRGNRFNDGTGSHQFYYQLYPNRQDDTASGNNPNESRDPSSERKTIDQLQGNLDHSEPMTSSTENINYETTVHFWTTTTPAPPCHTDHQEFTDSHTVTPSPGQTVPTVPTVGTRESKSQKFSYTATTEDHRTSEYAATTPSVFSETTSYYQYNDNRVTEADFAATTETPDDYRSTIYPQTDQTRPTEVPSRDYFSGTEVPGRSQGVSSRFNDRSESHSTSSGSGNTETRYTSQQYRQDPESYSKSTEKPVKSTFPYKPYTLTEKSLSPYDTSFTYKQGKVMSTLGPYVPFTKNYAYTTTKPESNSTVDSHSSVKSLIPKLKSVASLGKNKDHFGGAEYLPEKEHAMGMLNSLKNLVEESDVSNSSVKASYSSAPGSSTLHSLALYFSTATDSFDSSERLDSSAATEEFQIEERSELKDKGNVQVDSIPTGLLTQNTITSYAELFKLNNALENNGTNARVSGYNPEDYTEDLDIQQSSSSLEDEEKSNGTKLRELAQVFTHALSAYLLDPDAFKKVLTEIRPTEPPTTTESTDDWFSTTTAYPTTLEYDSLTTRDKDEVLDFSEAENDLARLQVTNTYPTTNTALPTIPETTITVENDESTLTTVSKSPTTRMTTVKATSTATTKSSSTKEDVGNRNRVGGFQNNTVSQVAAQPRAKNFRESQKENLVSSTQAPMAHYSASYGWTRQVTSKKPEQQLTPPFYDNKVRSNKEAESGKSQNRESKRNEYPHFLVPPFSSTSSSSIHRGRGINFVINKNEPQVSTTSERSTPLPSQDFQPPNFVPSKHYEPPQTTLEPSKHFEPPHSTPLTPRVLEEASSTVAPLRLVEEPPSFVPSRQFEPPPNERNYNRVRFFKSSQVAAGESEETLVTARTGYAKFRNFNRLDANTDTSEKSGRSTTAAPVTTYGSTVNPSTTLGTSTTNVRPTTVRPFTDLVSRTTTGRPFTDLVSRTTTVRPFTDLVSRTTTVRPFTDLVSRTTTVRPFTDLVSRTTTVRPFTDLVSRTTTVTPSTARPTTVGGFETTVNADGREAVTKRNRVESTPNGGLTNDHWTSSPAVTRLWETSVFIDPKRINQGLASDATVPSTTEVGTTQRTTRGHGDATHEAEFGDSSEDLGEQVDISKDDSNWGWVARDKDSPTAFTLLPASYSFESTGTPKPLITTRSSITTTITSSVTSTNSIPQDALVASLLPYKKLQNTSEDDVATKLFGKLNSTSSTTLMNVMRQADNNETVRQLVLLLVSYCRDPANDTMEREKDNLLDALLRLPVNEFASAESRNIVSSFDRHTLPSFRSRTVTNSTTTRSGGMLAQASTHSGFRKARRYRTTTEGSNAFNRTEKLVVPDNTLPEEDTTLPDNRALELLRSLYSIANKWG